MTARGVSVEKDQRFGTRLAGYRLEERIGQGGMGVVYRAVGPRGESVAVKLMLDELALDPLFRERFIREAEQVPAIDHPHIVPILASGEDHGSLFIVMELIDGPDLKKLIREHGRLSLGRTKELISQIASALDAAHEQGLVHRDVKAQNILIGGSLEQPHAYVTDFGLMKPIASETSISRTGQVFGSVPYMPPELIEGMPSDGRADVYALGCVLYECLTGQVPFVRANEVAMLWAHIHEQPPRPSALRPDLPGGVDDVVVRALQKHPDDRHLTCGELYEDLVAGMRRRKSVTHGSRTRMLVARARRKAAARDIWAPNFFPELARVESARRAIDWRKAALVAITFTVPLAGLVHVATPNGLPTALADVASAGSSFLVESFTGAPDEEQSADATELASASDRAPAPAPEPVPKHGNQPPPSEDGASTVPIASAPDERATEPEVMSGGIPAGDGGRIVFTRNTGGNSEIFSVRPDGSGERNLTNHPAADSTPAVSPNGRWIAFWSNRGEGADIFVMRSDGKSVRRLTSDDSYDTYPSWSPNGRALVFTSYPQGGCTTPACIGGWQSGDGDIRTIRLDGSGVRTLVSSQNNSFPDWSPDGKRIVFIRDGDIYMMELDGSGFTRLTATPSTERGPRWSPDGRHILYAYLGGVHVMTPSASTSTQVTPLGEGADSPAWSPDGKSIVYSRCAGATDCGRRHLWVIDASGGGSTRLSPPSGHDYFAHWGELR